MSCLNAVAYFDTKYIKGTIKFHQCHGKDGVDVYINLNIFSGYNPKIDITESRAIHIHEYGDERNGCTSLGGHWNPTNTTHGSKFTVTRHSGDLINNIIPDKNGHFEYNYHDNLLNINGNVDKSILGRSVVIHAEKDDYGLGGLNPYNEKLRKGSLTTGNAGNRIACAIIGRCKDGQIL